MIAAFITNKNNCVDSLNVCEIQADNSCPIFIQQGNQVMSVSLIDRDLDQLIDILKTRREELNNGRK